MVWCLYDIGNKVKKKQGQKANKKYPVNVIFDIIISEKPSRMVVCGSFPP